MPKPTKRDDEARELIRQFVQGQHDRTVWRSLLATAQKWRSGSLNDHQSKHVAEAFDFEIEPPKFLDELIAFIEKLEPHED